MLFMIAVVILLEMQAADLDGYISDEDLGGNTRFLSADTGFDDLARALSTRCSISTSHLTEREDSSEQGSNNEDARLPDFIGILEKTEEVFDVVMADPVEDIVPESSFKIGLRVPKKTVNSRNGKKNKSKKGVSPKSISYGISPGVIEEIDASAQEPVKKKSRPND
ncbi:MAG: hypothetical protein ACK4V2_04185 [Pseudomonadota bacterium]|jgi:hypothetical protein|nr:hypothetical protein [Alphaproteobacteria bacterium]